MLSNISKYWKFQFLGWGLFILVNIFFAYTFGKLGTDNQFPYRLITYISLGITTSHLMRFAIHRFKLLARPLQVQISGFLIVTFAFSIFLGVTESLLIEYLNLQPTQPGQKKIELPQRMISSIFSTFIFLFIWNCIYYIYHYIAKSQRQQLNTLKLESAVKELELKTIKSHINPHFIFNALNSIRALVDEDPARARTAITELSNILRSSMQAEKLETVPLHRELDIVRDYLALEQMRFEERLQVQFDIDEDTLNQPVPPMMLQTLVENAIKHGISKQINGGTVIIISDFIGNHHELVVQNSGQLNGTVNSDGFGIKSTQDRLNLLYQGRASFDIHNLGDKMVESKVVMPVTIEINQNEPAAKRLA